MVKDIRDWIAALEAKGLLSRYSKAIDVRNCSEIISEDFRTATYFENVEGYSNPVLANSVSSRQMMALALETSEREILSEYVRRISQPISPLFLRTESARCQELFCKRPDIDLTTLPILFQHEYDGAPYITAGVLVAKDLVSSEYNIGIYRLMFRTKNELGINITAPHKLRWFYQNALQRKQSLEVAVCIGLHALDLLAAVTSSPEGVDELALWGGLQRNAIRMVKCRTIDLFVPEHAEIVLECTMDPIGWSEPEGMYGEFPGTYSGMRKNPFLKIQAITSRKDAIYLSATHGGKHLAYTDFFVIIPQIELGICQALKSAGIDVRQVRILEESAGMVCFVSIQARAIGDSRNAVNIALTSSRQNFPKYCVVVDSDIDVFDNSAVTWAISTRSQPKDDTIILDGLRIPSSSDPSLSLGLRTMSKLGIDATIPYEAERSRFTYSKPPKMRDFSVSNEIGEAGNIESKILEYLKRNGPSFFYDVTMDFHDVSFRSILLAWSGLRENGRLELGMDGKYSVREK